MWKVKKILSVLLAASLLLGVTGCQTGSQGGSSGTAGNTDADVTGSESAGAQESEGAQGAQGTQGNSVFLADWEQMPVATPTDDYRTTYEIFVYSFYDSDGDGIGDLNGVTEKLDYLNDGDDATALDLGISQIWLMPVASAASYHKYDVTDYCAIDPEYGTMEDFEALVAACHERGVRVIVDMVLNHTSDQHPWFTAAADYLRNLEGEPDPEECPYVDYYHFSREAGQGYAALPDSDWYYEAQFWDGMPDLNLDSEAVKAELQYVLQFWLERGVDGFRLDAVTSYYTGDPQASTDFLTWVVSQGKEMDPDCYFVAEAWTDQATYAGYYASGIDSMFDFAFGDSGGGIAKLVKGSLPASSYGEGLAKEEELYASYNPEFVNAPFYTNHDMGRSTGYYAGDDGSRTKLAMALNLLMTGNAFIYYGEELGMKGSGRDENKRAPMYWSQDADAAGMCAGPPEMEEVEMKFESLTEQQTDPYSIWNYVRRAIRLRNLYPIIASGRTVPCTELSNEAVCVFGRTEKSDESADAAGTDAEMDNVLWIAVNMSETEQVIPVGDTLGSLQLDANLAVGEAEAKLADGQLTLPPFGIAFLEKAE